MLFEHRNDVRRIIVFAIAAGLLLAVSLYLRHTIRPLHSNTSSLKRGAADGQSIGHDSTITALGPTLGTKPQSNSPFSSIAEKSSLPHLLEFLETIKAEKDPGRRSELVRLLLNSVSGDQFQPLLTHLVAAGESQDLQADLIRHWTESSPSEAAKWATSLNSADQQENALKVVAAAWAEQDLPNALSWLDRLPTGPQRDLAAGAIAYEAARSDPLVALKLATGLPAGQQQDELVGRAIREWSAIEPAAAAEWALGISDASLRQKSIADIAVAWASKDPSSAATFATTHLPANETLSRVAVEIIQQWAAIDPAKAAAWAISFPDGDLKNTAIHQIISAWTDSSPTEIASWINQQPPGEFKNRSYAEYSEALAGSNPAGAIPMAEQIADESLRQEKLEIIAGRWLDVDPVSARSWIGSSTLSAAAKIRLLEPSNPVLGKP
jgi:hypothetical protein